MYLARQRQGQSGARLAAAGPMNPVSQMKYAGLGNETVAAPPPSQMPAGAWGGAAPSAPAIPAGFDSAGFLKQAKLNFIRLQEANDHADLQTLRDVTNEKLYEQLAADIRHRTGGAQHTDVVTLEASLIEVVTEGDTHWASVHFSGQISETAGSAPVPFAEVWHLTKPVSGDSGWLVAGIQQVS
jgi:predicted lipid-binding transport protein (Tim44 family)